MGSGTAASSGRDQCFCLNTNFRPHKFINLPGTRAPGPERTLRKISRTRSCSCFCWRLLTFTTTVLVLIACDRNSMMVQCSSTVISTSSSSSSASHAKSNSHISEIFSDNYVNNNEVGSLISDSEQNMKSNRNNKLFSTSDINKLQDLVMKGLNLTRLPLASEINISQKEYAEKYQLYLERLNGHDRRNRPSMMSSSNGIEPDEDDWLESELIFNTFKPNLTDYSTNRKRSRTRRSVVGSGDLVFVRFPLPHDDKLSAGIEEATLRLMLLRHQKTRHQNHHQHQNHHSETVNIKVYQLIEPHGRIWLDSARVAVKEVQEKGRWIDLDVRNAIHSWFDDGKTNLGFEVHCDLCEQNGLHIVHDSSKFGNDLSFDNFDEVEDDDEYSLKSSDDNSPALNIVTRVKTTRGKRSRLYKPYAQSNFRKPRHTHCNEHNNQKCCRNEMEVVFKELQGYEFIIQPKVFDAGYCRGKCPPKYNPASHHAVLQSLISKQDRRKAPRPCCAPKVLEDLQILHVDEHDPTKLKVATWSNMKVLECACS